MVLFGEFFFRREFVGALCAVGDREGLAWRAEDRARSWLWRAEDRARSFDSARRLASLRMTRCRLQLI